MPPPSSKHGFAINEKHYDWTTKTCKSAGKHWNPFSETHGEMNNMTYPSHVGNLLPIKDDAAGNAWYSTSAERPTLFGTHTILKKAMTIYENDDDLGLAGTWASLNWGTVGSPIACCNIIGFQITPTPVYPGPGDLVPLAPASKEDGGRKLDVEDEVEPFEGQWADFYDNEEADFDHFTLEEFEELFGKEEAEMLMSEELPAEELQIQQNP